MTPVQEIEAIAVTETQTPFPIVLKCSFGPEKHRLGSRAVNARPETVEWCFSKRIIYKVILLACEREHDAGRIPSISECQVF